MASSPLLPECPVCLQPFDHAAAAVPRVLSCGHSICHSCLSLLPPSSISSAASTDTVAGTAVVRCPACTQLVPLPRPISSLPKNIDLLRFINSPPSPRNLSPPQPMPAAELLPAVWTECFFSVWRPWVLPETYVSITNSDYDNTDIKIGYLTSDDRTWKCRDGHIIKLLAMNKPLKFCGNKNWKLSYVARVISSLWQFDEHAINELDILLKASWRCRLLGRMYGFWMDSDDENSPLFLVYERFEKNLFDVIMDDEMKKSVKMSDEEMVIFRDIFVGCCKTVLSLHSEGMVCGGCLVLSNFCFDELGHCVLDLSSILNTCRESKKCNMLSAGKAEAFMSPETFLLLCGACKSEDSVSYSSDIWSLACIISVLLLADLTLPRKLFEDCSGILSRGIGGNFAESIFSLYDDWGHKVASLLGDLLTGTRFESLVNIITICLDCDPYKRPSASDLLDWISSLCVKPHDDNGCLIGKSIKCCLLLNKLYSTPKEALNLLSDEPNEVAPNGGELSQEKDNGGLIGGSLGLDLELATLKGHRDCVTGLAVGDHALTYAH